MAGKPSVTRAEHLADLAVPMLFLQGSNDALAKLDLLRQTVDRLDGRATLDLIPDADQPFMCLRERGGLLATVSPLS